MPRKSRSIVNADEPSTADVSTHEDTEMQDQDQDQDQEDKMNGFKKFGVSATWPAFQFHSQRSWAWAQQDADVQGNQANIAATV